MSKIRDFHPPAGRILVVDDEPDVRDSVRDILALDMEDAEIVTAADGKEGLRALETGPFDLVISDYRMPGMDGLEFLRRAFERQPSSGRVLMTAYPELQVAVRAINEAAINNFLTKPVSVETLMEAVHAALVKSGRSYRVPRRRRAVAH